MNKKRVAIISPNPKSLYTNSVCELLLRKDVDIQLIIVKKFSIQRFIDEFSRDGSRLIVKIWRKLVLKERYYYNSKAFNIIDYRKELNLEISDVAEFEKNGTELLYTKNINSQRVEQKLKKSGCDLVIFTGGGLIRNNILNAVKHGVINCHMGILPKYRGMDVIEWAILEGDFSNIGITCHFMEKGVDTGPILKIKKIPILKNDSIQSIRARFEPIMIEEMVNVVLGILTSRIKPKVQNIEDGKQYFVMSKTLNKICRTNLLKYTESSF